MDQIITPDCPECGGTGCITVWGESLPPVPIGTIPCAACCQRWDDANPLPAKADPRDATIAELRAEATRMAIAHDRAMAGVQAEVRRLDAALADADNERLTAEDLLARLHVAHVEAQAMVCTAMAEGLRQTTILRTIVSGLDEVICATASDGAVENVQAWLAKQLATIGNAELPDVDYERHMRELAEADRDRLRARIDQLTVALRRIATDDRDWSVEAAGGCSCSRCTAHAALRDGGDDGG